MDQVQDDPNVSLPTAAAAYKHGEFYERILTAMDNSILNWVLSEVPNFPYLHDSWTKVVDATNSPIPEWKSPTYNKILGHKLPANLDINKTTVLGGICSIFTAETRRIRNKELAFKDIDDFEKWIYSWYPRMDQIHGTIGIPPKLCKTKGHLLRENTPNWYSN